MLLNPKCCKISRKAACSCCCYHRLKSEQVWLEWCASFHLEAHLCIICCWVLNFHLQLSVVGKFLPNTRIPNTRIAHPVKFGMCSLTLTSQLISHLITSVELFWCSLPLRLPFITNDNLGFLCWWVGTGWMWASSRSALAIVSIEHVQASPGPCAAIPAK